MLFEMLSGPAAFTRRTVGRDLHADLYEHPPALWPDRLVAAVDRVIHGRSPSLRRTATQIAEAMAEDLRAAMRSRTGTAARVRPMTRLIVLPFRVLRPDPDIDFLAFSLAGRDDRRRSRASSRSSSARACAASQFAAESPTCRAIASEAEVDIVLTGTLLRAGDQLRVTTQLLEAPGGTVVWSQTRRCRSATSSSSRTSSPTASSSRSGVPLTAREQRLLEARRAGDGEGVRVLPAGQPARRTSRRTGPSRGTCTCSACRRTRGTRRRGRGSAASTACSRSLRAGDGPTRT